MTLSIQRSMREKRGILDGTCSSGPAGQHCMAMLLIYVLNSLQNIGNYYLQTEAHKAIVWLGLSC